MSCRNCRKSRLERIIEGWYNLIIRDPVIEEMALKRAKVCAVCSSNVRNVCKECHCPLPAKTRSVEEKCDKNLWP